MGTIINIALICLGFFGTLAAFGGETWRKGDEPLLGRVTRRGWLSITFLCLTLILGVYKELRSAAEKDSLVAQVNRLRELLYGQSALLAAKRLEEIGAQERTGSVIDLQLSAVKSVFDKHSNRSFSVGGRAQRKDGPIPLRLEVPLQIDNFAFDVCGAKFQLAAQREFHESDCRKLNLNALVDTIPETTFEQGPFGPSVIAFLQFLGEMSVDQEKALNGAKSLVKDDQPNFSLDDLLKSASNACNASASVAATATQARLLSRVEASAQQLWWLFTFGYPVDANTDDGQRKSLDELHLGSSSELMLQLVNLDEALRGKEDVQQAFTLGRAAENVTAAYRMVGSGLAEALTACRKRQEQLAGERIEIEGRFQAGLADNP